MMQETEYGWFSDIESNPDVIYVEYAHIASKGIYQVRNVHIEFPPLPIEISLTGESLQTYYPEDTNKTTSTITYDGARRPERRRSEGLRVFSGDGSPSPEDKPSPVIPRTPTFLRHSGVLTYNISQTQYVDVPHIIYINEQSCVKPADNSPEKIQECFKWRTNCIQNALYIFTACAIVLVCWG